MGNAPETKALPLHKLELDPRIIPNRIHAVLYSCGILALFYHHIVRLWNAPTIPSFFIFLTMLVADVVLAFMWAMNQGFRWRPVRRQEFPENLPSVIREESEFPKLDVFICTADPYKEPPIGVVNTALSVMAFDYPAEKISVYVSDDGGSELTLFAFMEAAKFARHWLPFCKENKIVDRCPEVYFASNVVCPLPELKEMYEEVKARIERVMEVGRVEEVYKAEEWIFKVWRVQGFTRHDHPPVIQPLLQSDKDSDVGGGKISNLIYFSREKSRTHHHHFKAGALNALLRVSGRTSDALFILTLDCDMYSNDPGTALRALCYLVDEEMQRVAYVQFPQRYRGLNKQDIYACEHKRLFQINPQGMDGFQGPNYVGTGCFFRRRALYSSSSLSSGNNGNGSTVTNIGSSDEESQHLASCLYEDGTSWGHQVMYESMRDKIEGVVEKGRVSKELLENDHEQQLFSHWKTGFTQQDHPTILQVLLESKKEMDVTGSYLPNLVYVSREKRKSTHHNFKAGALNVLLRVSGAISNAPLILTLDCDMYSNDPQTPRRALCFLVQPNWRKMLNSNLAFVQFPQQFSQIDKNDIYGCEHKRLYQINPAGMDGLAGPAYVGSGCFFQRRAFYGPPSASREADDPERDTDTITASILQLAQDVASCNYEQRTTWGTKMGLRYGSLSEDLHTGYLMQIEGWKTVFCNPVRPAFLGDAPITLNDALSQNRRWCIGQLEVGFCNHNPLTVGTKHICIPMGFGYGFYAYWAFWSIPILSYGLLPQLTLLSNYPLFPKVSDPRFYLYAYLVLGAYGQDLLDFVLARGGTIQRWWSDQRIWMMRGASSFLFALLQFSLSRIGFSGFGFNVTSKVVDDDQSKRHKLGIFEFGVPSPLFLPPATIAVINLATFIAGLGTTLQKRCFSEMFVQIFISGYVVINSLPIYEAMFLRSDKGKMHIKTTMMALCIAYAVIAASLKF